MEYIVNNLFYCIYRRNILKCECVKCVKVFIYKGLRGLWKSDFLVFACGDVIVVVVGMVWYGVNLLLLLLLVVEGC